jgi:hypothetical protein
MSSPIVASTGAVVVNVCVSFSPNGKSLLIERGVNASLAILVCHLRGGGATSELARRELKMELERLEFSL